MKFLLLLALLVSPSSAHLSKLFHIFDKSTKFPLKCLYSNQFNKLSCTLRDEFISCDCMLYYPEGKKLSPFFGIGHLTRDYNNTNSEQVKILLYQVGQLFNDNEYFVNKMMEKEMNNYDLSLYYSPVDGDYGIRVFDKECFVNILDLFEQIEDVESRFGDIGEHEVNFAGQLEIHY